MKHLFVEYARLAAGPKATSADERLALAQKICDELTVHAQIEEEIFYTALGAAVPAATDLLGQAQAEHQDAKDMIAQIQSVDAADEQLDNLVAQLNRAIEHHVKEERADLFPKARAAANLDLAALGAQLRERQSQLQAEVESAA